MAKDYKMLIGGEWVEGKGKKLEVKNKFTGEVLGTVPQATKEEVEQAVAAAAAAFKITSQMPAHQRSLILEKTSVLIDKYKEDIARIIAQEAGKAWKYSLNEATRTVQTFKFAAEEAKKIHGETVPMDAAVGAENRLGFFLRTPKGVIAAISPFNFPLNLVAHKVAPALAAGNSLVLKPATYTPLTAVRLGEIMQEAGLPAGALNIVYGGGATVGEWLVTDPRIAMVTFTGSPEVGKAIKAKSGLKPVTLELGCNSATIIEADADLEKAVPRCAVSAFANSGQVCISLQRIYVHKKVAREFTEKLLAAAKKQKVGDPLDKDCDVGPMIDENEAVRAEAWIQEAVAKGAKILCGGKRQGAVLEPTVLANVQPDMKVVRSEIFAPVVSIIEYEDLEKAIEQVNDSTYGLQAGIYTNDINKAFLAVKKIDVGGIMVNDTSLFRADHMPYGGNKDSGIGREGLRYAIEEMTNIRMVVLNL
jgi:acyl-CoA reductase-like NAD-dependent aldehyde dehydrogenase